MRWLEVRRHSHTKKDAAQSRGSHLSAEGVSLARLVGESLGPFALVVTSESPRAIETAVAMGFAVDDTVEFPRAMCPVKSITTISGAGRGPTASMPSSSDAAAGSPASPRRTAASGPPLSKPCQTALLPQ
jgi:hypothetical protein